MLFKEISIVGAGNIGSAIVNGLLDSGQFTPEQITVFDKDPRTKNALLPLGIEIADSLQDAVKGSELIMLCVKPFHMRQVLSDLKKHLRKEQVLVSVAAGIGSADIKEVLGENISLVLAMPNTGIRVRQSMTCLSGIGTSEEEMQKVQSMFDLLGKTLVVEEKMMGAGTVIAGCGTAFGLRFIRATMNAAIEIGFTAKQGREMAMQITLASASLLVDTETHPEEEIDKVTTPGGITITAINEMESQGFSASVIKGILKAYGKVTE